MAENVLRAGEERWRTAFETLSKRFPSVTGDEIAEALRNANGHAGQAAKTFRKRLESQRNEELCVVPSDELPGRRVLQDDGAVRSLPVFERLCSRFPNATGDDVVAALRRAGGHPGVAAKSLRRTWSEVAIETSLNSVSSTASLALEGCSDPHAAVPSNYRAEPARQNDESNRMDDLPEGRALAQLFSTDDDLLDVTIRDAADLADVHGRISADCADDLLDVTVSCSALDSTAERTETETTEDGCVMEPVSTEASLAGHIDYSMPETVSAWTVCLDTANSQASGMSANVCGMHPFSAYLHGDPWDGCEDIAKEDLEAWFEHCANACQLIPRDVDSDWVASCAGPRPGRSALSPPRAATLKPSPSKTLFEAAWFAVFDEKSMVGAHGAAYCVP